MAPSLSAGGNDSETAAQSAVLLSGPPSHASEDIFTSVNLPVDARVPLKLKTKIWKNEFIDFGLLLANQFP